MYPDCRVGKHILASGDQLARVPLTNLDILARCAENRMPVGAHVLILADLGGIILPVSVNLSVNFVF